MKIANIDRENLHMFWTTWEIPVKFSKDLTYDTIKSHKKSGFHTLFWRYMFGKTVCSYLLDFLWEFE